MPFSGGIFTRLYSFVADAAASIPAQPNRFDAEFNGVAAALSNCITRDGQSLPYKSLPMGGYNFTSLGAATTSDQATTFGQFTALSQSYLGILGAGKIGTADNSTVQAKISSYDIALNSPTGALANAVGQASAFATSSQTQAGNAAAQASIAAAAVLGLPYFPYALNAGSSVGGANILPQGITSGTVGGTAITAATPGTYALTPTGGSFTGVAANLVVTSATAANIVIITPGRTTSASPTAPTFANPTGATLPSGTTLTANIGSQIGNGTGQIYVTSDAAGANLLYWQNTGTGIPVALLDGAGNPLRYPLAAQIAALQTAISAIQGEISPNLGAGTGLQITDARGFIGTIIDALGVKTAGTINGTTGSLLSLLLGSTATGAMLTVGGLPLTVTDSRGLIGAQLDSNGKFSAISIAGSGGGTILTSSVQPRIRIASNHGGYRPVQIKSNGTTQLTGTDRFSWVANANIRNVQLFFVNSIGGNGGTVAPIGNAITAVIAPEMQNSYALLYPDAGGCSGQPISSGGKTGYYIGDGAYVITRPIHDNQVLKASTQYYRVHKKVASGQYWPLTAVSSDYTWGGVSTTDTVTGSTITDGTDRTINWNDTSLMAPFASGSVGAWQAVAVIAEQVNPTPVVMVAGDSISDGYGGSALGRSYLTRGLDAGGVAWFNCGNPASTIFSNMTHYGYLTLLSGYVDHVVFHCGTNDIFAGAPVPVTSLGSFQSYLLQLATEVCRPGVKFWPCTIFPRVTSSDSFVTTANQTKSTANQPGGTMSAETLRIICNNWLRDATSTGAIAYLTANMPFGAAQVGQIIDPAALVEKNSDGSAVVYVSNGQQTAGTGGYWPVNGTASYATTDGIHPSDAIQIIAAAAIPAALAFALT
jgi:hypothetical protein